MLEGDYYGIDGTYLGNDGIDDHKVYVVTNGGVKKTYEQGNTTVNEIGEAYILDLTSITGITDTEFDIFAANIYNESFGMSYSEKVKVASAMMNRKSDDKYKDKSFKIMTDKLMFNRDLHAKKMSETDRNP